ncbi:fumarylacetoacetate (FAA) hydrolase (plasmid) [Agrobacterium vitis]|nr:fumarylacetoacetate (FAA) hydrolase [Agrobacterium vitis]
MMFRARPIVENKIGSFMTTFEFTPPQPASLAIHDSEARFPVRRIFCVGRNYAAHAREMGKDPDREPPFFFTKPADAVADNGSTIPYPPETRDFQYEIELIVAIGEDCFDIAEEKALDTVWGYGVGIDLTRRDLQLAARDKGRPWDWGKAFDLSAPIAPLRRASAVGHPRDGRIWLEVNSSVRQDADIAELIWDVPEIISILSRSMGLKRGDIIMTGTPAGVGAIVPGDRVTGGIDSLGEIAIEIAAPLAVAGSAGQAA